MGSECACGAFVVEEAEVKQKKLKKLFDEINFNYIRARCIFRMKET